MAPTDIKVRTTKPTDKPFKLTDGQGIHLLILVWISSPALIRYFTKLGETSIC